MSSEQRSDEADIEVPSLQGLDTIFAPSWAREDPEKVRQSSGRQPGAAAFGRSGHSGAPARRERGARHDARERQGPRPAPRGRRPEIFKERPQHHAAPVRTPPLPLTIRRKHPDLAQRYLLIFEREVTKARNAAAELPEKIPDLLDGYWQHLEGKE